MRLAVQHPRALLRYLSHSCLGSIGLALLLLIMGSQERAIASESTEIDGAAVAPVNHATPPESIDVAAVDVAAIPQTLNLTLYPLELHLLSPDVDLSAHHVVTNTTISQAGLTPPSLWWTDDQFGGKLLEHWLAYTGTDGTPRRVDLVVDRQLWGLYTYLQRYTFVNHFGTAAKDFGYSVRVFNDQGAPLAVYLCDFPPLSPEDVERINAQGLDTTDIRCNVGLESSGAGALRGRSGGFENLF